MKKTIYLLFALAFIGCGETKTNLPEEFDFGKTENGVYTNDFFDMEVSFNPDWAVQDKQQLNNLIETGTDIVVGEDKNLEAAIKAAQVNTAYLLTVFKHEVGAAVEFNPSFMIIAENTKNFPGIKTGEDYLFHSKKMLAQTQMAYRYEKEIFVKKIGGLDFHVMEAKLEYLNQVIIQDYVSTVTNGFSLSFVATYSTEDEKKELYEIIEKVKI